MVQRKRPASTLSPVHRPTLPFLGLVFVLVLFPPHTFSRETPRQREIIAALKVEAIASSAAATPSLLLLLQSDAFRDAARERGLTPSLYTAPATTILARLRAEAETAELVHNLALWTTNASEAADFGCPSCTGMFSTALCQLPHILLEDDALENPALRQSAVPALRT